MLTRRQVLKGMLGGGLAACAGRPATAADGQRRSRSRGKSSPPQQPTARAANGQTTRLVERQERGAEIWQVSTEDLLQSNIYCEQPYCSADGRHFIYERWHPEPKRRGLNRTDFVLTELATWRQRVLITGEGLEGCAISWDGRYFYCVRCPYWPKMELWRVELPDGEPEKVYEFSRGTWAGSRGSVSCDERYYVTQKRLDGPPHFAPALVDLKAGAERIIDQDFYIWGPHPLFHPSRPDRLLVTYRRGEVPPWVKDAPPYAGPKGTSLYLLSVRDGRRIPLRVGPPHTTPVQGHQAWSRLTGEVVLSVLTGPGFDWRTQGNLLAIREGGRHRVVARGYSFGHVGVSRCGRLFCCDDWSRGNRIVIGSVKTGRTAVVCYPKNTNRFGQRSHAHPYLTPDLKWVIFNSDRTGRPHVYAARVPERLIESLLKA